MATAVKKAKKAKASEQEWGELWEDAGDDAAEAAPPAKKKAKKVLDEPQEPQEVQATDPADLEPGAVVLFWEGYRGVIRDAYVPLDEFWVVDEESGEVVRDEAGDIVHFKSADLELVAGPPIAPPRKPGDDAKFGTPGGVVLIGSEQQMMKILHHFGSPDTKERHQPQLLLALPCPQCHADTLLSLASQGVDDDVRKLAQEQRPDMHVAIRVFNLKHAVQEMGPDLFRMENFYLMSAITIPYGWNDIEATKGWEKKWRRDVCNQIDVGPSARRLATGGDAHATPQAVGRSALGQECGVAVSMILWDEEVQRNIRQTLEVDLPLKFTDANDGIITVIVLPSDALVTVEDGILGFTEAADADYLADQSAIPATASAVEPVRSASGAARSAPVEEGNASGGPPVPARGAAPAAAAEAEPAPGAAVGPQGKTIAAWEAEQAQFAHLPKIPLDWVRVISQKTGEVYFFNKKTQEATFEKPEMPLPPGWTKQTSKSTGKSYYFHASRRKSQFDRPTE